jgi:hypothetical protein
VAAYAERVLVMHDGGIIDEVALPHRRGAGTGVPDPALLVKRLGKLNL